ncbi:Kelch motifGalactose oxidase central domain [Trypanosoma vivax]|uniref:Uncharacterized protein n=1 Tax=Trypanosoma vivax (strain Y486) TaxID=1055687 RepID=G0U7D8_TRYVY|nr:hypothetical protein TRVL_06338 [Trypanosoma vivax]KAH8620476.1 Kelch motifGalactose oxidase central domain [Trypanosoma vivax]CCC51796.1 conserved hypothetical protein [Trypanosoma vivax Y486]
MAAEFVHRKLNRYEWVDFVPTKAAPATTNTPAKELLGAAAACSEKRLFLCGGYDLRTGRSLSQVAEFDLTTKQWSSGTPLPERVRDAAAVAFGECCVLFGGSNDEEYTDNLWLLAPKVPSEMPPTGVSSKEPVPLAWSLIRPEGPCPSARVGHSMVLGVIGGEEDAPPASVIYLFGGFDGSKRLNDLWLLRLSSLTDNNTATWELVEAKSGVPPVPRDAAAVAFDSAGERLLVFGGFASFLQNDLHIFTLRGGANAWTSPPCLFAPSRRHGCVAAVSGGHFVVCLGCGEGGPVAQVLQLSLTDFKWSQLTLERDDLMGRSGAMGCVSEKGKRIVLFGGGSPPKLRTCLLELELEKPDTGGSRKK